MYDGHVDVDSEKEQCQMGCGTSCGKLSCRSLGELPRQLLVLCLYFSFEVLELMTVGGCNWFS